MYYVIRTSEDGDISIDAIAMKKEIVEILNENEESELELQYRVQSNDANWDKLDEMPTKLWIIKGELVKPKQITTWDV